MSLCPSTQVGVKPLGGIGLVERWQQLHIAQLWVRSDRAVEELGRAMAEHSVPAERQALEDVSLVLHDIVDALLEQEGRQWPPTRDQPDASDTDTDTTQEPDDE